VIEKSMESAANNAKLQSVKSENELISLSGSLANSITRAKAKDQQFDSTDIDLGSQMQDLNDRVTSGPDDEFPNGIDAKHGLDDGLVDAADASSRSLAGVFDSAANQQLAARESVRSNTANELDSSTGKFRNSIAPAVSVKLTSIANNNFENSQSVMTGEKTMKNAAEKLAKQLEIVKKLFGSEMTNESDLEGRLASSQDSLKSSLIGINSTLNDALHNLTISMGDWNRTHPLNVSQAIQNYISQMDSNGMRMMDAIVARAHYGVSQDQLSDSDFEKFSSQSLESVANSTDVLATRMSEHQTGLNDAENDVKNSLKKILNDADKAKKEASQSIRSNSDQQAAIKMAASSRDHDVMMRNMQAALNATNRTLDSATQRSETESSFMAGISATQMNSDLKIATDASTASKFMVNQSRKAIETATGIDHMDAAALGRDIRRYGDHLRNHINSVLSNVSDMDTNITDRIQSDKSELDLQLMMSRRSVKQLLETWSQYANYETKKFLDMKNLDNEYLATMESKVNTVNTTQRQNWLSTGDRVASLNGEIVNIFADYVDFSNRVESGITGYKDAVDVLNKTTGIGISQLQESAFNFNANDDFVDKTDRNNLLTVIEKFENEIDKRTIQVEQSVGINSPKS